MLKFLSMVDDSGRQSFDGLDITLDKEPFIIGRAKSSDLVIALLDLSREHCKLYCYDGKWLLEDTSKSGTFVNDDKLLPKKPRVLIHNDVIKLSTSAVYKFEYDVNDKKPLSQVSFSTSNIKENESLDGYVPESQLKVLVAEEAEKRRKLEQKFAADIQAQKQKLETLEEKLKSVNEKLLLAEQKQISFDRKQEEWKHEKEFLIFEGEKRKNRVEEVRDEYNKLLEDEKEKFDIQKEHMEKARKAFIITSDFMENKLESVRKKLELSTKKHDSEEEKHLKEKELLVQENKLLLKEKIRLEEEVKQVSEALERSSSEVTSLTSERDSLRQDKESLTATVENLQTDIVRIHAENDFSAVNQLHLIEELVESELQCSICTEIVVNAQTLICGHTFCQSCIDEWREKNPQCPNCRRKVKRTFPSRMLDNFVGKIGDTLTDEFKTKRDQIVKEKNEHVAYKRMRFDEIGLEPQAFIDLTTTPAPPYPDL